MLENVRLNFKYMLNTLDLNVSNKNKLVGCFLNIYNTFDVIIYL